MVGGVGEREALDSPPLCAQLSGTICLATHWGVTVDTTMRLLDAPATAPWNVTDG